jgi:ATP phosphoribosyltransferase
MSDMRNDDPNFDVMGNFDHGLTLALSKGRILKETLPLLETAGINLLEDPDKSRKLIFPTTHKHVRILILRASDVPTYVENGAADIGVAGKDVLMEHGAQNVYEPLDLKIANCKLMTLVKSAWFVRRSFKDCNQVCQFDPSILCKLGRAS